MTTLRYVDVDQMLCQLFRTSDELTGVTAVDEMPPDWVQRLPLLCASRVAGAAVDMRGIDSAICSVDAYATGKTAAMRLARTAEFVLWDAWRRQVTTEFGYIGDFSEQVGPSEIRTGSSVSGRVSGVAPAHGAIRIQATYLLTVRPPQ